MTSSNIYNRNIRESRNTDTNTLERAVYGKLTVNRILLEEKEAISFKIPLYHKIVYREKIAPYPLKRRMLIESLKELILKISETDLAIENNAVVVNLQPQIVIENRIENRPEINIDLSALKDILKELMELVNAGIKYAVSENDRLRYNMIKRKLDLINKMVVRN